MRLEWFWRPRGRPPRGFGHTWRCSPVRRTIQAVCLLVFLGLFFYVCWPYTARPARRWSDWMPVELDVQTGRVTVARDAPSADLPRGGQILHVEDQGVEADGYLGAFRVVRAAEHEWVLEPGESFDAEGRERLAASVGPWSIGEAQPGAWPSHYAEELLAKEWLPAESFLALDPLVSLSAALTGRVMVGALTAASVVLLVCLVVPRGFCGYVCPLGTLIDLFDTAIARLRPRAPVLRRRWWPQLKYGLLAAVLAGSLCGVLLSGYVAAIPVVTRAMAFLVAPLQTGLQRGWHQMPPLGPGHGLSVGLFLLVLGLSFLRPRFWCRYLCPTGAVFSLANRLRLTERKVTADCIGCHRCVDVCPFDAIDADYRTRTADCTFCQTCGGACPVEAIRFVPRWERVDAKPVSETEAAGSWHPDRRDVLVALAGLAAGAAGGAAGAALTRSLGAAPDGRSSRLVVRPPGAVPEKLFLQLCVRCGECFRACPNDALQALGFEQGLEGLWTPRLVADWSGCEPSCSNCGQVCPTGAIRPLTIEEKRTTRIGLAVVDRRTCLPYAGREACQLCVDECLTAGYRAIEFLRVGTQTDDAGRPLAGSGFLAPVVLADRCVGCGLCQTRCHAINVVQKRRLKVSAIRVEAGPGQEDRRPPHAPAGHDHPALPDEPLPEERPSPAEPRTEYLPEFLR